MNQPEPRSILSVGMQWASRVSTIGLEFALPPLMGVGLDRWLADAASSELPPFVGFTRGIATDRAAVYAAFTLPWSTGPVEGHVHKIKLLKRQAYGRAGLPQLPARILAA